jgi:hypothetical protein
MEDLQARLAVASPDLSGLVARFETFREPLPGDVPEPAGRPPKLYQPAHGHFYLVSASLVCRLPGLPDHVVDAGRSQSAGFVLRRVPADGREEAWVADPADPRKRRWGETVDRQALAEGEEVLPLFPVNYQVEGKRRRLLVGLVPTSSRETFESAAAFAPPDAEGDPRLAEARTRVVDPLRALLAMQPPDPALPDDQRTAILAAMEAQQQEASRFVLLDLADLLVSHLPGLWDALRAGQAPAGGAATGPLYALLDGSSVEDGAAPSWRVALGQVWDARAAIGAGQAPAGLAPNLARTGLAPATLDAALEGALGSIATPPLARSVPVPKLTPDGESRYLLRCLYRRPRCGPLRPDVLSPPTAPFTIAPFFDSDAPARPVRIVLPDPSIAALRRFKKNVGIVTSAALRQQMNRVTGLKDALDGKFSGGGAFALGEICSFSIPIITLCAFMVLMIFLILLNLVFWWLPFLKICLPIVKKG